jgi:hypothetical protein
MPTLLLAVGILVLGLLNSLIVTEMLMPVASGMYRR